MAMTPAEKSRRYRERKHLKQLEELRDTGMAGQKLKPFFEYLNDDPNLSIIEESLGGAGLEMPVFKDDGGPLEHATEEFREASDHEFAEVASNSLGRAQIIVGNLATAAIELAGIINGYLESELRGQLATIEESELTEPDARKTAMAEIVRLNKKLDLLKRRVRFDFPEWKLGR